MSLPLASSARYIVDHGTSFWLNCKESRVTHKQIIGKRLRTAGAGRTVSELRLRAHLLFIGWLRLTAWRTYRTKNLSGLHGSAWWKPPFHGTGWSMVRTAISRNVPIQLELTGQCNTTSCFHFWRYYLKPCSSSGWTAWKQHVAALRISQTELMQMRRASWLVGGGTSSNMHSYGGILLKASQALQLERQYPCASFERVAACARIYQFVNTPRSSEQETLIEASLGNTCTWPLLPPVPKWRNHYCCLGAHRIKTLHASGRALLLNGLWALVH